MTVTDPRIDRLYQLLPAIYRMRDAEQGYPLQALLRVIAEQVDVVEDDISQLYDNWFIETADDWAVPYLGALIGYHPVLDEGEASNAATGKAQKLNRVLIPRREVANTIRYRRRKGTLAILELLAADIAGWPARAVEFYRLLGWNQNLNHLHLDRARSINLRRMRSLGVLDGPFDLLPHTVDVRRINSKYRHGRYNIPSVGLYVWRLKSYSVTRSPAYCAESSGPHCTTFSVLGQDTPLFIKPEPETTPAHIAKEMNVPAPIRRLALEEDKTLFYGEGKSLAIWAEGWGGFDPAEPIPAKNIIPSDLTDWQYLPPLNHIAVDPVLGRFSFPPSQLPKKGIRVMYHYGFSADIGGGEYSRELFDPVERYTPPVILTEEIAVAGPQPATPSSMEDIAEGATLVIDANTPREETIHVQSITDKTLTADFAKTHPSGAAIQFAVHYRVGPDQPFKTLRTALEAWNQDQPAAAVIELNESRVYVQPIAIVLKRDQYLQIRAANRKRPVMRMLDYQTDLPDALAVTMSRGSRLTFDGLLITGRPLQIIGPEHEEGEQGPAPICGAEVVIRHCTLVPGWEIGYDCEPKRPAEASLELYNVRAKTRIEHSIIGSIQIHEDEVRTDPIPITITDSIVDATHPEKEAIGAPGFPVAHAILTIERTTVFGIIDVHAVNLAENCIFNNCVNVARRQIGCMRFCYVPPGCNTPRRYRCQPDSVVREIREKIPIADQPAMIAVESLRVQPQFNSIRYGTPTYAQLGLECADEIKRGADDESEMGAFHDLFQPQREANLQARLEEYTPAGMNVGVLLAT